MGQNAEDIKLENDTFALRRDYKRALENLQNIKQETAEVLNILDKAKKDYEEKQEDLKKVINDISQERLEWAKYRNIELSELESKKSETNNILKKENQLNIKEKDIKEIEQKNTDILNETRRLELKIEQDKIILSNKEKELEVIKDNFNKEKEEFSKEKSQFKDKISNLLKEWTKY